MTGTVLLIFDVALGLNGGVTAAVFVLLAIVLLAVLPARHARRSGGSGTSGPGTR
jgi:hypothetical protein